MSHHPYDVAGHLPGDMSPAEAADGLAFLAEDERSILSPAAQAAMRVLIDHAHAAAHPAEAAPGDDECAAINPATGRACIRCIDHVGDHRAFKPSGGDELWSRAAALPAEDPEGMPDSDPCPTCGVFWFAGQAGVDGTGIMAAAAHPAEGAPICPSCGDRGWVCSVCDYVLDGHDGDRCPAHHPEYGFTCILPNHTGPHFDMGGGHWDENGQRQPAAAPGQGRERELYEQLAAAQHDIWSHWMRYLLGTKSYRIDSEPTGRGLREADVQHWQRQIDTPYADLTEAEKASDREQVDRFWHLIRPAAAHSAEEPGDLEPIRDLIDHADRVGVGSQARAWFVGHDVSIHISDLRDAAAHRCYPAAAPGQGREQELAAELRDTASDLDRLADNAYAAEEYGDAGTLLDAASTVRKARRALRSQDCQPTAAPPAEETPGASRRDALVQALYRELMTSGRYAGARPSVVQDKAERMADVALAVIQPAAAPGQGREQELAAWLDEQIETARQRAADAEARGWDHLADAQEMKRDTLREVRDRLRAHGGDQDACGDCGADHCGAGETCSRVCCPKCQAERDDHFWNRHALAHGGDQEGQR